MGSNLSKAYGVKWFYIGFLGLIGSIKSGIACAAFYLSKSCFHKLVSFSHGMVNEYKQPTSFCPSNLKKELFLKQQHLNSTKDWSNP